MRIGPRKQGIEALRRMLRPVLYCLTRAFVHYGTESFIVAGIGGSGGAAGLDTGG